MQPGEVIAGKFRIERVLGEGGMGVVVVARHLQLEQTVALKFLHDSIASDPEVVERLVREARASAKLRSEHVCRVMDVGMLETGKPYIVMELLVGQDLALIIDRAPLPPLIAAEFVLQACVAICEAHMAGIVHRDLKPSNLFVTERLDGTPLVKVLDFGIAKGAASSDFHITRTTAVMGTPGYMSPEQLRSSKDVDARSDIWSLGAILYEAASGRLPFRAESITELAVKASIDPFEPIDVPPAYYKVISRCLEKSVDRRYQTIAELALDLAPIAGSRGASSAAMIARLSRGSMAAMAAPSEAANLPTVRARVPAAAPDIATVRDRPPTPAPYAAPYVPPPSEQAPRMYVVEAQTPPRKDPTPRMPGPAAPRPPTAQMTAVPMMTTTVPPPPGSSRSPLLLIVLGLLVVAGAVTGGVMWQRSRATPAAAPDDTHTGSSAHHVRHAPDDTTPSGPTADATVVRFSSRDGKDAAALVKLGLDGSSNTLPSARIRDAQSTAVHVVIGVEATNAFLGDPDPHGAFVGAQDLLAQVARAEVGPKSTASVYTLGHTTERIYSGALSGLQKSVLGTADRYHGESVFDLEGGLTQMLGDIRSANASGRVLLVVISGSATLRDGVAVRLQKEVAEAGIELHYLWVGGDAVPEAVTTFAGKSVEQVGAGDRLPASAVDLASRLASEAVIEFDVPTSAWQAAHACSFFTKSTVHTFDITGRTEFSD